MVGTLIGTGDTQNLIQSEPAPPQIIPINTAWVYGIAVYLPHHHLFPLEFHKRKPWSFYLDLVIVFIQLKSKDTPFALTREMERFEYLI